MKSRVADFEEGMAPVLPPEAVEALSLRPGDGVGRSMGPEGVVPGRSEMRRPTLADMLVEAERLGGVAPEDVVDWGADVGSEVIDDVAAH